MGRVFKAFNKVTDLSVWVGNLALVFIVLIVFANVVGRYVLRNPITGSYELVLLAMTILGGFSIAFTALQRGHVNIDLVVSRFSRRARITIQVACSFLSFATWGVLAYQVYIRSLTVINVGSSTTQLEIRIGPFLVALSFAILLACLVTLGQALRPEVPQEKPGEREVL